MTNKIDTTCEHIKLRLIAAAVGLQHCTATDGTEVLIPGTGKRILIGDDAYLARAALPAGAELTVEGRPPLPWNLDATKRSLVLPLRAGEVADAMHRYAETAVAVALARRAPAPAAPADERVVFLRQDSSFGPWIECDADHVNAVRFVAAHQAAPAQPSAAPNAGSNMYRKTALVKAEQFLPAEGKIPHGVYSDGHGDPRKDTRCSWALDTKEGKHYLRNGDYICTGPQGEQWNVERSIFESTYELAAAPTSDQQAGTTEESIVEIMLAMQIAAEKLEWIAAGEAPGKDYDLDGGKVVATIRHAKQMATYALTRLQPARATMKRLFRSGLKVAAPAAIEQAGAPKLSDRRLCLFNGGECKADDPCIHCRVEQAGAQPVAWTKERITELATSMAEDVAKNVGSVPQLTFPHIYLGLSKALAAPTPATDQDKARLDFIIQHEAWVAFGKDGESCRVFHRDSEGDAVPMLGWGARHWRHDPREAIDAARASLAATPVTDQPKQGDA